MSRTRSGLWRHGAPPGLPDAATFVDRESRAARSRDVFGPGTKDPQVVRYAMAARRVLVTADRPLSNRLRQSRTVPCLFLRDLRSREETRTAELFAVVLAEFGLLGSRFWMEIANDYFRVAR